MAQTADLEPVPDLPEGDPESDQVLLDAVRSGDRGAFGQLWARHADSARRLAASIAPSRDVDDLVSESFTRVLRAIDGGGGPTTAFRPYLLSTIRRVAIDTGRTYSNRVRLTDDEDELDLPTLITPSEKVVDREEQQVVWSAWKSLPEETQTLLWHLCVEDETPAQLAPVLGTTANGVSSRAKRAKERLRQAFLSEYAAGGAAAATSEECQDVRRQLGAHVRDGLSSRDQAAVRAHLDGCDSCGVALLAVTDTNAAMRVLILPLVVGGTTIGVKYLAAGTAAKGAAAVVGAGAAAGGGWAWWPIPGLTSPGKVAAAGAGAVAAAGIAAAAFAMSGDSDAPARAAQQPAPPAASAPARPAPAAPKAAAPKPVPEAPSAPSAPAAPKAPAAKAPAPPEASATSPASLP
ncbi:sigma-70 family RNA polymerase sigma factor [Luteipulveratus halotolerans]|uniref:sigma-70 family RNA polymerase sigma factor n=1 Tax=Luteipulveratus halotolerans TaxID=1631356 RepID=UPI0006823665|nr:sigma-70 family RNA polymerase sigma factor [Luteipulveratus halotolerans]